MKINIDEPRWDQTTYIGRAKHFLLTTNPGNLFKSGKELDWAKDVVTKYRKNDPGVAGLSEEELWRAKNLYDSAFHPDTGEKMLLVGRMSAQVPMNMTITGLMMTFYKTPAQVIFWQWINQSFNAIVNYTNRSGSKPIEASTLGISYVAATGGALTTALGLNSVVKSLPPIVGRFVPFAAVSAANCINIPLMRQSELSEGVPVFIKDGTQIGNSLIAAREGIAMTTFSRILMASPGMLILPFVMNSLERRGLFKKFPRLNAPIQVGLLGTILTFATPLCCAIFEQKASISLSKVEPELREKVHSLDANQDTLYYNKGL